MKSFEGADSTHEPDHVDTLNWESEPEQEGKNDTRNREPQTQRTKTPAAETLQLPNGNPLKESFRGFPLKGTPKKPSLRARPQEAHTLVLGLLVNEDVDGALEQDVAWVRV